MSKFSQAKLVRLNRDWNISHTEFDYKLKSSKWKTNIPYKQAKKDLKITIHKNATAWKELIFSFIRDIGWFILHPSKLRQFAPSNWMKPGKKVKSNKLKANKNYWVVFGKKVDVHTTDCIRIRE